MVVDRASFLSLRTLSPPKSLSGRSSTPSKVAALPLWMATFPKTPAEAAPVFSTSKFPQASPQVSTPSPGAGSTASATASST
ncbi:hypothetical protein EMPG_17239 [Blastomyces silverae]|uniref:Uncharacterized protein n=1 Tax=Blastomyces silverae TaxID=2060906 RepID=A0A0H1B721_9EURO|nr:hypothetical protein EMPG_17239 [Blastomyces silverae]